MLMFVDLGIWEVWKVFFDNVKCLLYVYVLWNGKYFVFLICYIVLIIYLRLFYIFENYDFNSCVDENNL